MISVIVPAFNVELYIEKCIKSILCQSYQDFEIICIDDGSTDGTCAILEGIAKSTNKLRVIEQNNRGVSAARNKGISLARGDYILFVDGDDELVDGAFEKLISAMKEDVDVVVSSAQISYTSETEKFRNSDASIYNVRSCGKKYISDAKQIDSIYVNPWGKLYRKGFIDNLGARFPEGILYEDAYWHWVLFSRGAKVAFVRDVTYKYYRRDAGIMGKTYKREVGYAISHLFVVEEYIKYCVENNIFCKKISQIEDLLHSYFWLAFWYSPDFERPRVCYECARIILKYRLECERYEVLSNVRDGRIGYLFRDEANQINYKRYLKLMGLVDTIVPPGSFSRRCTLKFLRTGYRITSKLVNIPKALKNYVVGTFSRSLVVRALMYRMLIFLRRRSYCYKIMSPEDTLKCIKDKKLSFIRLGEGEFRMLTVKGGYDIKFQKFDDILRSSLRSVVESSQDGLLICIPGPFAKRFGNFNWYALAFWTWHVYKTIPLLGDCVANDRLYGDSLITRPYIDYRDKSQAKERFNAFRDLWTGREVVVIEGAHTRIGVGNDLLDNAASVKRILVPSIDAFSSYERILEEALKMRKDALFLLAIGPTAKILGYTLFKAGRTVYDVGHLDIEYEWFLRKSTSKETIPGKYVNEVDGESYVYDKAIDCNKKYLDEIVARINC